MEQVDEREEQVLIAADNSRQLRKCLMTGQMPRLRGEFESLLVLSETSSKRPRFILGEEVSTQRLMSKCACDVRAACIDAAHARGLH